MSYPGNRPRDGSQGNSGRGIAVESQGDSVADLRCESHRESAGLSQGHRRVHAPSHPDGQLQRETENHLLRDSRSDSRKGLDGDVWDESYGFSRGSPSPKPVGCPEATRSGDGPWMVRAP